MGACFAFTFFNDCKSKYQRGNSNNVRTDEIENLVKKALKGREISSLFFLRPSGFFFISAEMLFLLPR
ncbi:MAG: hypothetical protein DRJ05_13140 [Bacteroidetes bacterium]|nr:MAG: hypothetical protein DRJ05_13140 [Bacteroidota bacterium]